MTAPLVPLGNLFRMLCYSWERVGDERLQGLAADDFDRVEDLLGSLLARATRDILRRGLARGYVDLVEDRRAPKGKIDTAATMKRQLALRGRVQCEFHDISEDIPPNRILRAALKRIAPLVSRPELARDLRVLDMKFSHVSLGPVRASAFANGLLTTGQRHYRFALDLCELLSRWLVPTDGAEGHYQLVDPRRSDREMGRLFESFVRAFLAREARVHVVPERQLRWALVPASKEAAAILPVMETDIRVRTQDSLLLIETKFTNDPLPRGPHGKRKLRSTHLYQLHAYVTHLQHSVPPLREAVLLIGTVGQSFAVQFDGPVKWSAVCVDLGGPWRDLHEQLLRIFPASRGHVTSVDRALPAAVVST